MKVSELFRPLGLLLAFLLIGVEVWSIEVEQHFDKEEALEFVDGFQFIESLKIPGPIHPDFIKVFFPGSKIPISLYGVELKKWLDQRVKYIISTKSQSQRRRLLRRYQGEEFEFPVNHISKGFYREVRNDGQAYLIPVMSNFGADAYYSSLYDESHELRAFPRSLFFLFTGQDGKKLRIPITSPRVGLIEVKGGLNRVDRYFGNDEKGRLIYKMMELIHEARHSDGSRKAGNLRFPHVICPKGHQYASIPSPLCDDGHNGSNMVSALALEEVVKGCRGECDIHSKILLNLMKLERRYRVLGLKNYDDDSGAKREQLLELHKWGQIYRQFEGKNSSAAKTQAARAKEKIEQLQIQINVGQEGARVEQPSRVDPAKFSDPSPEQAQWKRGGG